MTNSEPNGPNEAPSQPPTGPPSEPPRRSEQAPAPAQPVADDPTTLLARYPDYDDAQRVVDHLSDEGFDVSDMSIVWAGLRRVEHVTGRRTIITAARDGAVTGLWFGGIAGLLLSSFVDLEEGASVLGVVVTYAIVGAVAVAIWQAMGHWGRRGARDFATVPKMDAERYEVWVPGSRLVEAQRLLGFPITPSPR